MKKKILSVIPVFGLILSLMTGCVSPKAELIKAEQLRSEQLRIASEEAMSEEVSEIPVTSEEITSEPEETVKTKTGKVRAGNRIVIPAEVNTIVSMAPSVTEVLITLGLEDKIVAIDTYSGKSPFASSLKEDLPQFDMMAPDNEAIIALEPDVVITTGMSYAEGNDVYSAVKAAGVCVADIPSSESIDDIEEDIRFIGNITGEDRGAEKIIDEMNSAKDTIKALGVGITDKKTVLYVMTVPTADYPEVYTCGSNTYMDEIFTLVGLENIAADVEVPWPALSEEQIIAADPDVIIVGDTFAEDPVKDILSIDEWKNIKAVREKAVYAIDGDAFNQPDQYVMNSAYEIAVAVYPDIYSVLEKPFK